MRYTYVYKTSDGGRHEAAMEAPSRDAVFAELRKRGIRAIKVFAADGSKANGETRFVVRKRFLAAALCVGLCVGVGVAVYAPRVRNDISRIGRYHEGMGEKIAALARTADDILHEHDRKLAATAIATLTDYGAVFSATNAAPFQLAVQDGYREFNASRKKVRDLFRPLYDIFPADCANERSDAQRLYADAMDALDRSEARFIRAEKAYRLLVANRGKWTVRGGDVVFADGQLAAQFAYLRRGPDSSEVRWSRDFEK